MTETIARKLLAAYLQSRKDHRQAKAGAPPLAPKTLVGYLNAAHKYLECVSGKTFSIREGGGSKPRLLPIFDDIISHSRRWREPFPKREGYTWPIFEELHRMVLEATRDDITAYLDMIPAVFDWLRMGCFTGCRAGEYAQTVAPKGTFSKVPMGNAAGRWQGFATAFIRQDFVFLDKRTHILPINWTTLHHSQEVVQVHVCFRFDKSPNNFVVRKFARGTGFFCPVDAALSIVRRSLILHTTEKEPLGVHRIGTRGGHTYLRSCDVIDTVREACRRAYPDPKHYLRQHITRLVAHSNRVTAAVALHARGWSIERIADRLRWSPEAVKHYIRESSHTIGGMTADAIAGAQLLQ